MMVWACVKIDYKCTGKEDRKLELGKFKKGVRKSKDDFEDKSEKGYE